MDTKIFARFDDQGSVIGFYDTDIFPDDVTYEDKPEPTEDDPDPKAVIKTQTRNPAIPADAIEITEEQRRDIITYPDRWRFNGKTIEEYTPPPPPIFVPEKITNFQMRAVLIGLKLFEDVDNRVHSSKDTMLIQSWDYQADFQRGSYFVKWLESEFLMKQNDLDKIFVDGEKII